MKKFKNLSDLEDFKSLKTKASYNTTIGDPVTSDEIDIIFGKKDVMISEFNRVKSKISNRVDEIMHLLAEINNVSFGWWDWNANYDEDNNNDIRIYDDFFQYYFETPNGWFSFSEEDSLPNTYLSMSKDQIIKDYINMVYNSNYNRINKLIKSGLDRKKAKENDIDTINSIKSKLSENEYKFILRKMGITKKKIIKLGL